MFKNKSVMFVVAHPDDEVLGCGAFIHRLVSLEKAAVKVVILGEGLTSRDPRRDVAQKTAELEQHRACIKEAQKILGYQKLSIHQFPDNRFDSVDLLDLVKVIETEKNEFKPDYLFTHHHGDLNIDHRKTFESALTASRPLENETLKGFFTFNTPSATEWAFDLDTTSFQPNYFVELSRDSLQAKLKAMDSYKFEIREYPHPRSLEALNNSAKTVGSRIGFHHAEQFKIVWLKS
jgi:LmbE family N-acetylglucosaminyl deacetylase